MIVFDPAKIAQGNAVRVTFPNSRTSSIQGTVTGIHNETLNVEHRIAGRRGVLLVEADDIFNGSLIFQWTDSDGVRRQYPQDPLFCDDGSGGSGSVTAAQVSTSNPAYTVQDAIDAGMAHTPIGFGADFHRPHGIRPEEWATNSAIAIVREVTEKTLQRARGGYWYTQYGDPSWPNLHLLGSVPAHLQRQAIDDNPSSPSYGEVIFRPFDENPFGVELGLWDTINNQVEVTKYSSPETINLTQPGVGDWVRADAELPDIDLGWDTVVSYKAALSSFGATDWANPESDDEQATVWFGQHEFMSLRFSWNEITAVDDVMGMINIAVKNDFVYLQMRQSQLQSDVNAFAAENCFVMKYKKAAAQESFTLDAPVTFTAYPSSMWAYDMGGNILSYGGMPLVVSYIDFGTQIQPPASRLILGHKDYPAIDGEFRVPETAITDMFPNIQRGFVRPTLPSAGSSFNIVSGNSFSITAFNALWSNKWRLEGCLSITSTGTVSGTVAIAEVPDYFTSAHHISFGSTQNIPVLVSVGGAAPTLMNVRYNIGTRRFTLTSLPSHPSGTQFYIFFGGTVIG